MADTDATGAIDNGGVKRITAGDKTVEYHGVKDALEAQRNQDRRAGTRRSFTLSKCRIDQG